MDITKACVSFQTSAAAVVDREANSSSPLVRSLLARVQNMGVKSAMPAAGCGRSTQGLPSAAVFARSPGDAGSSTALWSSLLALLCVSMWRRWHPQSPSPRPGAANPKRKLYSSPGKRELCSVPSCPRINRSRAAFAYCFLLCKRSVIWRGLPQRPQLYVEAALATAMPMHAQHDFRAAQVLDCARSLASGIAGPATIGNFQSTMRR